MKKLFVLILISQTIILANCATPSNTSYNNTKYHDRIAIHDISPWYDTYPWVCAVYDVRSSIIPIASGFLYRDKYVITAGHISSISTLSHVSFNNIRNYKIMGTITHPDHKENDNSPAPFALADIGILILDMAPDIKTLPLYPSTDYELSYNDDLIIIGYARIVKSITLPGVIKYWGTFEKDDSIKWLANPTSAGLGDSGGPVVLINTKYETLEIVGVISHNIMLNDIVIISGATRVDHYIYWINQVTNN